MNNAIKPEKNMEMRILTGIAILLVLCGHLDLQTFTLFDLFPYYSFHVLIFVFVSGYFYKETNEVHPFQYIGKKAIHLLVPYFIWNILYGILVTCLHRLGFGFGTDISPKSLFIDSFIDGHQYMLNFASWFVPALFLLHAANILGRSIIGFIFRKRRGDFLKEILILFVSLILGMATIMLAIKGHVWGYWKLPGRILFMLPVYEMGIFYKKYIAKYANKVPDFVMIAVVVCVQLIIRMTCRSLVFSAVWCSGFNNGPVIPYITVITGLVFWYRIAKLLNRTKLRMVISSIGDISFSLMMHHILAFFLINSFAYYMYLNHKQMGYELFDIHRYLYSVDYVYWIYDLPVTKWLYLIIGLTFSALLHKVEAEVKNYILRKSKKVFK